MMPDNREAYTWTVDESVLLDAAVAERIRRGNQNFERIEEGLNHWGLGAFDVVDGKIVEKTVDQGRQLDI